MPDLISNSFERVHKRLQRLFNCYLIFFLHVHSHVRFTYRSTESQITFTSPGPLWMKSNLIFYACYMALTSITRFSCTQYLDIWESLRKPSGTPRERNKLWASIKCLNIYIRPEKLIVSLSDYLCSHTVIDFRWCLLQKAIHLSLSSTKIEEPVVQRQQHAEGVWQ